MDQQGVNISTALTEAMKVPPEHVLGFSALSRAGVVPVSPEAKPGDGFKKKEPKWKRQLDDKELGQVAVLQKRLMEQGRENKRLSELGNTRNVQDQRRGGRSSLERERPFERERSRDRSPAGPYTRTCHDFNNARGCGRVKCAFEHRCEICGSKNHGAARCSAKRR